MLPEALLLKSGTKVTTAALWRRRRAEILQDFEREIYGRRPKNVPRVRWEVTGTTQAMSGDELARIVRETIAETGATSKAQMGAVMKAVQAKVAGRADSRTLSAELQKQLAS